MRAEDVISNNHSWNLIALKISKNITLNIAKNMQ